jgi:zinc protease
VPLVSVILVFHAAGADADPAGAEGLASLTASLLLEGTSTRSGQALTDAFEALGSSLSANADWDATTVGFTVQPQHLATALALTTEVVRAPAFPAHELARLQGEHASDRLQGLTEPRVLAELATQWCVFDGAARYRRPSSGTTATVNALDTEAVRRFWSTRFTPGTLTVVMTGDVTTDEAERAAATIVEGWDAPTPSPVVVSTLPRHTAPHVHMIHRPDAPQSELRIARVGVPRVHAEYFARTLMNAIFGGLFSSRINLNLRERNGYTYGAHAGFDWRRHAGPWSASTAVGTDVTTAAARELLFEIAQMQQAPVTEDELSLATSFLTGVFPLRFESTQAVAGALATQAILGLPTTYYDEYRDAINGVTAAQIQAIAQEHFTPSALQMIVVGDATKLRAEFEALAFGPILLHEVDAIERAP